MSKFPHINSSPSRRQKTLSFKLPAYIKWTTKLLENLHPKLATWFALKLFFRPLKFPIQKREMPLREKAKVHNLKTGKSEFSVFQWGDSGKKAVFLHGWSGRGTQFHQIIVRMLEAGYQCFAIEAPAHGNSMQKNTDLLEFRDSLLTTSAKFGDFDISIGHSLGGMAIFNALEKGFKTSQVVTIGMPANIPNVVKDFCQHINATDQIAERMINNIETLYSMNINESSSDHLAGKHDPPGLIIHDVDDLDVDVENAYALNERWPNASLFITRGKGHRKVLVEDTVITAILGLIPLT